MALTKQEIEKFKKILLESRAHILHSIKGTQEDVKDADESKGYSQHQADEGTDDFGKTIILEVANKGYSVLKQIEKALTRIEEGTYGTCELTGKEIPKARLEAIPYATMTVEAQQKLERGEFE